ncbi:hypothetical protein [Pseudomonas aeruginosa]|uniref:hypothetical protein n=1 Tax=Pseudomonas aeruginosa TaxID=287 RepID=UPI00068F3EB4|nr:hypothetical protein [Pseudomonas aeruginosa]
MNKAQNECTCPSGDGSLRWPCPAHPAVEQAGGDERAAFELFVRKHCGMPAHIAVNWDAKFTNDAWEGWKARAALAQPYPPPHPAPDLDFSRPLETENGDPVKWICADVIEYKSARVCVAKDTGLVYSSPYIGLKIRNVMPEQAEAERPEVAGYRSKESGMVYEQDYGLNNPEALTTVAECERIVGALRAVITQLRQHKNDYMDAGQETYRALQNEIREREAEIARLDGLVSSRTTERDAALARVAELKTMSHNYCALLMDANAKLAELEKQEPINLQHMAVAADGELRWMTGRKIDNCELYAMPDFGQAPKLYAAPVVQAQQLNDLDKQCRDDVARALGLRPNQERGFAWSYLLASIKSCVKASGDSAQAQHSVPEASEQEKEQGWTLDYRFVERVTELAASRTEYTTSMEATEQVLLAARELLAAAPVCRLSRSALTDAQMRRLYDSSTETENERLGFAAFARLIRRAEAVHQIAAAPGKEVGHE